MSTRFIVAAIVGVVVGVALEDPQAGATAFSLTYGATGFLDPAVHNFGPRLSDLSAPTANAGDPIPWVEGHPRKAFNIAYASDKHEIANTTEQDKGGPSVDNTTFTYEQDLLIILSEKTGLSPRRIWDSGKLVWTAADQSDAESIDASQNNSSFCREIRSYTGGPTQLPDPDYEAAVGVGNAPAHRGVSSAWISGLNLGQSGYPRILTIELGTVSEEGGFFEEKFDDGLTPYTLSGPEIFSIESSDFGPALKAASGVSFAFSAEAIRSFAPTPFTTASFKFQVLPPLSDPSSVAILESTAMGVLSPASHAAFGFVGNRGHSLGFNPNAGKPCVFNDASGEFPIFDSELEMSEWYSVVVAIESDTSVKFTLSLMETGAILSETSVPYTDTSILSANGLFFSTPALPVGGPFRLQGALFDEITFGSSPRVGIDDAPLDQVVLRQCLRSGLDESQVNVTRLEGQFVRSMALSQLTSGRQTIETLAWAYLFGAAEYGRTVEFFPFGAAAEGVIPWDEFGASIDGTTADRLPETLINDIEQPSTLIVTYADVDNDYQKGSQQDSRGVTKSKIVNSNEVAIGLTATEAKRTAMVQMGRIAAGLLHVGPFTLSLAWAHVMPCDVWWLERADGSLIRAYIMKRTDSDDILTFEAVVDEASVIDAPIPVVTGGTSSYTVRRPSATIWEPLDIAKLRQADDDAGFYGAATWRSGKGSVVFRSQDGTAYAQAATHTNKAVIGHAVNALPDWDGRYQWDESSTLDVVLEDGELSSYMREQGMTSTAGAMLVGDEILQYRLATMTADLEYTLSGFLRVRRGTEWAGADHLAGERIVLLDASTLRRILIEPGQLNIPQQYKAVTIGRSLAETAAQPFTDTGAALKPFSPVTLRVSRTTSGYVFEWDRRTRDFFYWLNEPPLGETSEAYEIEIWRHGFTGLVHTMESSVPSVAYSDAQISTQWGVPPAEVAVKVYQLSQVVGRGYAGEFEIALPTAGAGTPGGDNGAVGSPGLFPFVEFPGEVRAGGTSGSVYTSADGGATYTLAASGLTAPSAFSMTAVLGSQYLSIEINHFANYAGMAVGTDDPTVVPTVSADNPASQDWRINGYPRTAASAVIDTSALYSDGSHYFIVGRLGDQISTPQPSENLYLFKADTSLAFSLEGQLAQAADPNELPASPGYGTFGLSGLQPRMLTKIAGRWFLLGGAALYYTDDSAGLTGWLRCPTGLAEGVGFNSAQLGSLILVGSSLVVINRQLLTACISVSTDNGETWTASRPAGFSLVDALQNAVSFGGEAFVYFTRTIGGGGATYVAHAAPAFSSWTIAPVDGLLPPTSEYLENEFLGTPIATSAGIVATTSRSRTLFSADGVSFPPAVFS